MAQGSYLNWVVGNFTIPAVDDDPTHEGIQKIDTAVLVATLNGKQIQMTLDNAAAGLN